MESDFGPEGMGLIPDVIKNPPLKNYQFLYGAFLKDFPWVFQVTSKFVLRKNFFGHIRENKD